MTNYFVTADHVSPKFACKRRPVRAYRCVHASYSVQIDGYGCSKEYSSIEKAIYGMLQEHACTNIRIHAEG